MPDLPSNMSQGHYTDFQPPFYQPQTPHNNTAHLYPQQLLANVHGNGLNQPPVFSPDNMQSRQGLQPAPSPVQNSPPAMAQLTVGNTRPRGNGGYATDSDDDEQQPATKKIKTANKKVVDMAGQQFGLMYDMYREIRKAIQLRLQHGDLAPAGLLPHDAKLYNLGYALFKILPDIKSRIIAGGETGMATLSAAMHDSRKDLHSALANITRSHIHKWYTFEPQLSTIPKDFHGFHHLQTGALLCPVDLNYKDPKVRQGLRDCEYIKYPIGPDHFPRYLWPDNADLEDDDQFIALIFRSDWVLKAVTLFLYGPEAALKMQAASTVFGADSANSKARADTWGIDTITPACIAMAAVMVRHALSDQKVFRIGDMKEFRAKTKARIKSSSSWPYKSFYHLLIDHIENTMTEAQRKSLLDWFTRKVLGNAIEDTNDLDLGDADESEAINRPMTSLERLKALSRRDRDLPPAIPPSEPTASTSAI